jgi:hypothetical protein
LQPDGEAEMEDPIIVEGESMDAPFVLDERAAEDLAPPEEDTCQAGF